MPEAIEVLGNSEKKDRVAGAPVPLGAMRKPPLAF